MEVKKATGLQGEDLKHAFAKMTDGSKDQRIL